jgi:DNA replication protein DnaC
MSNTEVMKKFWMMKSSNIPVRYQDWNKEKVELESGKKFPAAIDSWIDSLLAGEVIKNPGGLGSTGVGLLFVGPPGRGKTTHAVVAGLEAIRRLPDDDDAIKRIFHVDDKDYGQKFRALRFLTFPEFLHLKKSAFDADPDERRLIQMQVDGLHGRAKDDQYNVRILILDDLGKEYGSSYDDATFDEILRSRYDKGLPTIITTNVPVENWKEQYSEAMESFAHEAFQHIRIQNKDLRKERK